MKAIRKILMGLAAVVGFTTVATAATPVAVWDGDFSKTIEGYTLDLNGNTEEEGVITIDQSQGVKVNWTTAMKSGMTVLFKYSNLTLGSQQTIATSCINSDGTGDRTGVYLDANNKSHGIWANTSTYDSNVTTQETMTDAQLSGNFVLTYKGGSGTYLYRVADAACKCIYGNPKLMSGNDGSIYGCTVGGTRGTTFAAATGLQITAIAVFDKVLSEAEMKAYQFPSEIKTYYATMDGDTGFSTLNWNPEKPEEGFTATDTLIITNIATSVANLNIDENLSALKLKIVSEPAEDTGVSITKDNDMTVAIGTYDFSEAENLTYIEYETAASVIAGADTVLAGANNPSLTIAEGKKLTVSYETEVVPTLTASKVSNAGTLHFMGGTEESPIYIDGGVEAGLGTITLAEDTYVKQDDKGTATKYTVTGSGASSFFTVARNSTGAPGMKSGSSFADVIVGSAATASGKEYWLEHATIADTVGLNLTGNLKLSDLTPNPVVIRSLTGTYNLANNNGNPSLTICCQEDANFAGTSGIPITIGEGEGTQTFSGAFNKALTVEEGGNVTLAGAANPSSIANAGTVTVDPNGAAKTITGAITGEGTIYVTDSSEEGLGSVAFTGDRSEFTGTIIYTRGLYDIGTARVLDIPEGVELQEGVNIAATQTHDEFGTGADTTITGLTDGMLVVLTKLDGTTETLTAEDGEVTFPGSGMPKIDGVATLFDVTFTNFVWDMEHKNNGTFSYKGVAGATLQYDTDPTFANTNGEAQVKDIGVYIKHHPYINGAAAAFNALGDFTGVFVGEMSPTANRIFVHFGSSLDQNQGIIITTLAEKDAVGVFSNVGSTLTELTELSVPNAATARHVYIVTKKEVAGDTVFTIYLDGVKRAEKTIAGKFVLGTSKHCGVQVGADFGGKIRTGTYKAVDNVDTETGVLNVCRIYDYLLTDDQVAALTTEYPYVSEGGLYTRTIAGEVDYAATASWAKDPSSTPEYDVPTGTEKFSPSATLTASDEAVVTVNTNSEVDVFTFNGSAMSFVKDAEGTNKVSVGTAVINAPITIQYGALDLSKAAVSLAGNGAVTFDLEDFPLSSYFASTQIQMTGLTDQKDSKITAINIPESEGREVEFLFEDGVYNLVITVEEYPFVYEEDVWTWSWEEVTAETVSNNTALAITVLSDLEWPIDRSGVTVEAGTLTVTAVTKRAAAVTVEADAVLDLNGNQAKEMALTLNGGKVTYGNTKLGEADQIKVLTLTADSEINTPVKGQIYAASYGTATTIALDTYTLTKTGTDVLQVVNTDITGTGTIDIQEGEFYGSEDTRATNVTFKVAEGATLHNRSGKTMTIATIEGAGGTLNNEGTMSAFTLKNGEATLSGNGTWGKITLESKWTNPAVLNVGTIRGLTLAGDGTVNAVLTAAEIAQEGPITVFTTDSADVKGGTVKDEAGNVVPGNWAGGSFKVDHEAKIGDAYYLTFKAAFDAAKDKEEIELCKDVELTESLIVDKALTFNLAEKTITAAFAQEKADYVAPIFVTTNGNLTVTGNGTIAGYTATEAAALDGKSIITVDAGTLNFVNGTLTAGGVGSDGMYGIYVLGDGTVMTGTYGEEGGPTITTWFAAIGANNTTAPVTVYINGGTFTAQADGTDAWWNYFCAPIYASADGVYTIYGGTFNGNFCLSTRYANVEQYITIADGTFNAPLLVQEEQGAGATTDRVVTKAAELEIALPEGYFWKDDTTLAKLSEEAEAKIGDTYYLTLNAALEAAEAGQTVTLCKDITTDKAAAFTIAKNITIDFATFTITKTVANDWVFQIAKDADVTFTGTTGGIVHYPAVLNQVNPASMIQILGKLTVAGGVYKSDYTIFKVDEDDGATHTAKGELVVNGGTFTIEPQAGTTYTGTTYAIMNWSKATLNGGTFTGDITTLSNDGNACSKAGETIVGEEVEGTPVYKLQVTGSTYENVPKIKGVDKADVTLIKSSSITDELELTEKDGYVTVQKKSAGPTPAPGSDVDVKPVPGAENTYTVEPTGEDTALTIQGVKDGDTLIIEGAKVDSLTFNTGVTPTVVVKNASGTIIPNGAFYGLSGNSFNAALNPEGVVEGVKVQPTIETSEEIPTPFVVGTDASTTIKAIPGLTYTLKRGSEIGTYDDTADTQVAEEATVTLTDSDKPADKAFYIIQVIK